MGFDPMHQRAKRYERVEKEFHDSLRKDHSEPCGCRAIWWPGITGEGEWKWVVACSKHSARMDPDYYFPHYDEPKKAELR